MANLAPCPSCGRHVRVDEPSCPFCSARFEEPPTPVRGDWGRKIARVGAAAALAGSLTACGTGGGQALYGAPAEPDPAADAGDTLMDAGDMGEVGADYGSPP